MQETCGRRDAGRQAAMSRLMNRLLTNPEGVTIRLLKRELPELFCERVLRQLAARQLVRHEGNCWVPTSLLLRPSPVRLERPGPAQWVLRTPFYRLVRSARTSVPWRAMVALCAWSGTQLFALSRPCFQLIRAPVDCGLLGETVRRR